MKIPNGRCAESWRAYREMEQVAIATRHPVPPMGFYPEVDLCWGYQEVDQAFRFIPTVIPFHAVEVMD